MLLHFFGFEVKLCNHFWYRPMEAAGCHGDRIKYWLFFSDSSANCVAGNGRAVSESNGQKGDNASSKIREKQNSYRVKAAIEQQRSMKKQKSTHSTADKAVTSAKRLKFSAKRENSSGLVINRVRRGCPVPLLWRTVVGIT